MASVYNHPKGYVVRFYLYLPDGTRRLMNRYSKNRQKALDMKQDAALLESLTKRERINYEEIVYFRHQGLISEEDLSLIAGSRLRAPVSWDALRKDYETFSDAAHSAHNHKTVKCRLNNLEEHFKELPIASITVHDILAWQNKRRDQKAAVKTIKSERDVLNQVLDMAVDRGAIPFNPGRHKLLKGTLKLDKARLPRALTYDEVKSLFDIINGEKANLLGGHIRLAALICLFGGLRRGELCYLTRDDLKGNEIIIRSKKVSEEESRDPDVRREGTWKPKSNRPRVIDLPPKVAKAIRALMPKEGRFIFGGDHVLHKDYIGSEFKEVLDKVGAGLSLHSLRHTFVTWRIEHGISGKGDNLVRVQLVAGHADIQTTMNYTHIKVSLQKNILDLV